MKLKITVHGVAYEVDVEVLDPGEGFPPSSALPIAPLAPGRAAATRASAPAASHPGQPAATVPSASTADRRSVASPVAGTVLEVHCRNGEAIELNKVLFVLEAMKMKTSIVAPGVGRVAQILVAPGDAVQEGQALLHYE
ncbi:MAG: acetyl-CoA carboxylase biotin carboxyl carrier protein subunit [Thermoanaerobaculia bacterium]|jgi:biotin carboxyl carrier protein|nr:acetyl-CoA carboxylase biotin carboxyl carrier protein subunit [Thermoanaerobaculia bacterium]MBP9825999.1 acetyl-CoA carboxylase biotin carboxyl carrier protein subunit [Thermoanaerobaculia bacterium]